MFSVRPRVCTYRARMCQGTHRGRTRHPRSTVYMYISEKYPSISRRVCQMLYVFPAQAKTVRRSEQEQCVRIARAKASFWDGCETYLKAKGRTTLRVLTSGCSISFLVLLTINVTALVSMSVSLFLSLFRNP